MTFLAGILGIVAGFIGALYYVERRIHRYQVRIVENNEDMGNSKIVALWRVRDELWRFWI